jgi:8-oxo-dGTP pyrophosphatase MutT (NUDIX family)
MTEVTSTVRSTARILPQGPRRGHGRGSITGVERIGTRVVYENPWMTVREDEVRRRDGSTGVYGVVEKPDFALVLPRGEGGFWMVEQFRYPVGRRAWEFPQGSWGQGASGTATALARAELAEETGLDAARLEHLGHLYEAYGFSTQGFDVYLATGLTPGEPHREPTERDMVHRFVADDELGRMIRSGAVVDAPSLAALTLYRLQQAATTGPPAGMRDLPGS